MEYVHGGDIYTYGDVLDFSVNVNPYGPSEEEIGRASVGKECSERCRSRWSPYH